MTSKAPQRRSRQKPFYGDGKHAYYDLQSEAEQRRAFILEHMANAEIDGRILVENMAMIERWLTDGTVPVKPAVKGLAKGSATG